jgi:hypothetical protein
MILNGFWLIQGPDLLGLLLTAQQVRLGQNVPWEARRQIVMSEPASKFCEGGIRCSGVFR